MGSWNITTALTDESRNHRRERTIQSLSLSVLTNTQLICTIAGNNLLLLQARIAPPSHYSTSDLYFLAYSSITAWL